jgi:hypothetical protein
MANYAFALVSRRCCRMRTDVPKGSEADI